MAYMHSCIPKGAQRIIQNNRTTSSVEIGFAQPLCTSLKNGVKSTQITPPAPTAARLRYTDQHFNLSYHEASDQVPRQEQITGNADPPRTQSTQPLKALPRRTHVHRRPYHGVARSSASPFWSCYVSGGCSRSSFRRVCLRSNRHKSARPRGGCWSLR